MAAPQFCPWCGTPIAYVEHEHEPRHETLAREARSEGHEPPALPERVARTLSGDAFVGACAGCRKVSHVVSHEAPAG